MGEGLDNAKFNEDWEANGKVMNLAKEALANGSPPHDVRELVLQSDVFREWSYMERSFAVEYHEMFIYTDLLGEIEFTRYDNHIREIATSTMAGLKINNEVYSWNNEYDKLFDQIGIKITPVELGENIGLLCKKLNLVKPLGEIKLILHNG